jgi:dihydrofolate synthase / folylpolyglutamate synthase
VRSSPAIVASWMPSNRRWIESLSPWPEKFGLERMERLLAELGGPERTSPAIHIVGTNGKTTTARLLEALLDSAGLTVGTYTSPHVLGWEERIRVGAEPVDFEAALGRIRPAAQAVGSTQFEALTAAALAEFAAAKVDVAVVEAGLGGRLDATNVLRAPVVVLTNVDLEHTDVLGTTREAIAAEKLAVLSPGAVAVLGEPEWEELARAHGAGSVVVAGFSSLALAIAAAETFLGSPVDPHAAEGVVVPGRLERVGEAPLEIWDGAHNLAGVGWLLARLPTARYVVVASILADKNADGMLAALGAVGDRLVATRSSNPRALPAEELGQRGARFFRQVEAIPNPADARVRARDLAGEEGAVLVCGSLYLLSDLAAVRPPPVPWGASASG